MAKDKDYIRMIHTARWLRLRRDKLSDCPLCERCEEEGRYSLAVEVHHVVPVEDAVSVQNKERLMFDYHNLQALCHACHVKTHQEMGRSGKAYAERKRRNGITGFARKFLGIGLALLTMAVLVDCKGATYKRRHSAVWLPIGDVWVPIHDPNCPCYHQNDTIDRRACE